MAEQKVFNGNGTITEKSEKVKGDESKYWSFKITMSSIDGIRIQKESQKANNFSLWEYPAGNDVSVGDKVELFWTEKEYTNQFGNPGVYRNINSIAKTNNNEVKGEIIKDVPTVADYVNREEIKEKKRNDAILFGQCLNLVCATCFEKEMNVKENLEPMMNNLFPLAKELRDKMLK